MFLRRLGRLALALVTLCGVATSRASLLIEMNTPYTPSGAQPAGSARFGTATFEDVAANQVKLTVSLNLQVTSEFITNWYFNVDSALDLDQTLVSLQSGQAASSVVLDQNEINVPGSGDADIRFTFTTANNSNRFNGTELAVYLFQNDGPGLLTSGSFKNLFSNAGNKPNFLSAIHVQGLDGGGSVHVGGTLTTAMPEPSSIVLTGLGLGGIGLIGLARRRRALRSA
jgi:hypothetical protein